RSHLGGPFAPRGLGLSVSSPTSACALTAGGNLTDSGLGRGDAAPKQCADSRAELAELRRARAAYPSAFRQHLGCVDYEGLPLVFSLHCRAGAVVWAGVRVRSWY